MCVGIEASVAGVDEFHKAVGDFTEAIRIDPTLADAFNRRGIVLFHQGEHDKAIADFNEAIRIDPKHVDAHFNRSTFWRDQGDEAKAQADFELAGQYETERLPK